MKLSHNLKNIWSKFFLIIWNIIFFCIVIVFVVLHTAAKDKIIEAPIILPKQSPSPVNSLYHYEARIQFPSNIFRYQNNIATIEILNYNWHIDSDIITDIQHTGNGNGRTLLLTTTQPLIDIEILGTIDYKTHFSIAFLYNLCFYFICGIVGWFICLPIFQYTPSFKNHLVPLTTKDTIFLGGVVILCVGIGAFTFWLGFPGVVQIDAWYNVGLHKGNWHPVFISYFLELLYMLFGKHLYYLFLCNLIPFYVGICFIICGFYIRFRTPLALIFIFPTFIGNIYFHNFVQYHSFALPMMLFCLYAMLLFHILASPVLQNKKVVLGFFWIAFFILMFCTLLWRHNAIFSVFPICFVLIFLFLQNNNFNLLRYTVSLAFSAIIMISIVVLVPKILTKDKEYPANHMILMQIAGSCAPANDSSCFLEEWYNPNKTFEDVKKIYRDTPTNPDYFAAPWVDSPVFKTNQELPYLARQWIYSILSHPINFIHHELLFIRNMWFTHPVWILSPKEIQEPFFNPLWITDIKFPENEQKITFTPAQEAIYSFLYTYRITFFIPPVYVAMGIVLLIISSRLLYKKYVRGHQADDNNIQHILLVFVWSTSFASFGTALMVALFSPVTAERYMSPVLPLSLMALIGFIAFLWNRQQKKPCNTRKTESPILY